MVDLPKAEAETRFYLRMLQKQENNVNQLPLLPVNLLMTIYNNGIFSPDSAGAFFLFLAFLLCCQLTFRNNRFLLNGEGCQQHLRIVAVRV